MSPLKRSVAGIVAAMGPSPPELAVAFFIGARLCASGFLRKKGITAPKQNVLGKDGAHNPACID